MLNAGFQYLEQRDANDKITKDGVVGKNSPFATSDNSGIYDIIAEDLRWLKENVDDVKDTSDLEAIKQSVTDMYNEMKNDSSFGEAAAKAQAEEAKKQAQAALESATNAKTYRDDVVTKSTEANDTLAEIKTYIDKAEKLVESNKALEQSFSDYVTVATNKAKVASDSATNAKASETNAKTSETNAAKSESDAKAHMNATATSASNAKASESAAKKSETNSKTSETNAKASESAAKTSETNASNSADLAKKWAESSESPDTMNDEDSTTGKTQSSKSWALYSKDRAISAYSSESNAKASETASKTSETNTKASETNAKASETAAKASETNAKASETNAATSATSAKTSETNAATSATSAKTSETNASTSKDSAATSETNAKSYMDTTKGYMDKTQEAYESAQAIQSIVDTAKANAEKCVADVEAVKESLSKIMTYQGSVDNYSDLPTNPQVGYSYNVKNADKTHGVNAGDNVVWNGESWDNLGGSVDMSLFAELGKDVRFNAVTATTFTGNLKGTADNATTADTATRATAADNANRLGGYPLNSYSIGGNWGTVPRIGTDGGMEVGKYIDWHPVNGGSADYTSRWEANSDGTVTVGTINGTLNGNAATATKLQTSRTISLTGKAAGSTSFDGSANASINVKSVNADTASKLSTARKINITGNATGAASFDGTSDVNISVTVNESKHAAAATTVNATAPNGGAADLAFGTMAANDYARIRVYGKNDNGALEIATADAGTEPIYARQYGGAYDWPNGRPGTVVNEAAILDSNGNTKFPKNVTAASFTGPLKGNADTASKLNTVGGGATTFNWVGKAGQPIWLWGGNNSAPTEQYVYNPSNFHVASANTATSATTAGNVSNKIYYSSDSPSVATDKLFTVKQAHAGDDNVPNNGLVIQLGPTGANYNGKLYITDNGGDGVWVGGVAEGKEVGWKRLVENWGSWNINSATATTALNVPTSDVGGNIWIS